MEYQVSVEGLAKDKSLKLIYYTPLLFDTFDTYSRYYTLVYHFLWDVMPDSESIQTLHNNLLVGNCTQTLNHKGCLLTANIKQVQCYYYADIDISGACTYQLRSPVYTAKEPLVQEIMTKLYTILGECSNIYEKYDTTVEMLSNAIYNVEDNNPNFQYVIDLITVDGPVKINITMMRIVVKQ